MQQTWKAELYAKNGAFVAGHAGEVLRSLDAQPGQLILNLGCGDGALTAEIVASGAVVTGLDSSPEMVQAARAAG